MNTPAATEPALRLVLHVEDNEDHADLVRACLSRHNPDSRIHRVEDGAAALDYLARTASGSAERPYLILLDLRLPKIDGIEVLKTVRATPDLSTIPIVVLTTSGSDSDVANAYENHVNSYLVKPDDFSALDTMMRDLGEYWLEWNLQPDGRH